MEAVNKSDGTFDFDLTQMITNCLMAFLVHAGHHSVVEVAECYNRLLDYIAIDHLEQKGPSPTMVESLLPYFRIGSYHSFLINLTLTLYFKI